MTNVALQTDPSGGMREILFRGQTRRKGEKVHMFTGEPVESNWVYGGVFPNNKGGDFAIIYQYDPEVKKFPVYADTVCQFTGLKDKNGMRIFEGDIIKVSEGCLECDNGVGKVEFYEGIWYVSGDVQNSLYDLVHLGEHEIEVIGNVFDNKELLGGGSVEETGDKRDA